MHNWIYFFFFSHLKAFGYDFMGAETLRIKRVKNGSMDFSAILVRKTDKTFDTKNNFLLINEIFTILNV